MMWSRSYKPRPRRERPNFFVGFRVTSSDIVTKVEELQTAVRNACPDVTPCHVDPKTLHVTLCVLRLPNDEAIDRACQVLQSEAAKVATEEFVCNSLPCFNFSGWDLFGINDVLYAKLDVESADGRRLSAVAERLHDAFDQLGFTTEKFRRPFTPHVTVWKTSCDRELIKKLNRNRDYSVQDEVCQVVKPFNGANKSLVRLGNERPKSIELLSMKEREDDGYYRQVASALWLPRLKRQHI